MIKENKTENSAEDRVGETSKATKTFDVKQQVMDDVDLASIVVHSPKVSSLGTVEYLSMNFCVCVCACACVYICVCVWKEAFFF